MSPASSSTTPDGDPSAVGAEPAVRCVGVSKRYRLGVGQESLKELLVGLPDKIRGRRLPRTFLALHDIDFEIARGEVLGIIGPNGAGKTTILRLLANVTQPTHGHIEVAGRLSALIALGAGFHPDLSGAENVYLNAAILGLRRETIRSRFDEIVRFAELERFIDTPVKRYSSGMYARLGFAVAAHVEPDILIVDEVLSVGDTAFQAKCFDRMESLKRQGTTLVFVSHNMSAIQRVCTRVLVLSRGRIHYSGAPAEAIGEYAVLARSRVSAIERPDSPESGALTERQMTGEARVRGVLIRDEAGCSTRVVQSDRPFSVEFEIEYKVVAPSPVIACTISDDSGTVLYDVTSRALDVLLDDGVPGGVQHVRFQMVAHLLDGVHHVKVDVAYSDLSCYYDHLAYAASFVVVGAGRAQGLVDLGAHLELEPSVAAVPLQRDGDLGPDLPEQRSAGAERR